MNDMDYHNPENSRNLAFLVLSDRDRSLDALETAFLFGTDVEALRREYESHQEQAEEWSSAALEARDDGDADEAQACLHEARHWAQGANVLHEARQLCLGRPGLPVPDWPFTDLVGRLHAASVLRWDRVRQVEEESGGPGDPDPGVVAAEHAEQQLREEFFAAFGEATAAYSRTIGG